MSLHNTFRVVAVAGLSAVGAMALTPSSVDAALVYGLTTDNTLISFDSGSPTVITSGVTISGLDANETLRGIDFRPTGPGTGTLYGVGSFSQLYTINTSTGVATQVGGTFSTTLNGSAFGVDFNPSVDRIRLHSDTTQNLRFNPDTGAVAATDPNLFYAAGDVHAGQTPVVTGTAYTPTGLGGATTLYSIDSLKNTLLVHSNGAGQPAGSFSQVNTVGSLTVDPSNLVGFDIAPDGSAYASFVPVGDVVTQFYTINLGTGQATATGLIGGGLLINDITVAIPEPATAGLLALGGLIAIRRVRRAR